MITYSDALIAGWCSQVTWRKYRGRLKKTDNGEKQGERKFEPSLCTDRNWKQRKKTSSAVWFWECPIINWSECSSCEIFWMRLDSEWMRMILTASCVWEFDVSDIVASLYCWSLHACLMPALWVCCKKFWVCALVWSTVEIGKWILSQGPLLLQDCWCLAVTVCHQWL